MSAGCALALVCACASPRARAQASSPSSSSAGSAAAGSSTPSPKSTAPVAKSKSKHAPTHKSGKKKSTARGQQKIDSERAQAIQEALIREHYLSGQAAGTWNQSSEEAMRRYQADHGWQSKTVPDSRALISLGLGPSHDHLLNPESAMVNGPFAPRSSSSTPVSRSADPGTGVNAKPAPPVAPAPTAPDHDPQGPQ